MKKTNRTKAFIVQVGATFIFSMTSAAATSIWNDVLWPKIRERFSKKSRVGFL